jgi:hypothetical protein
MVNFSNTLNSTRPSDHAILRSLYTPQDSSSIRETCQSDANCVCPFHLYTWGKFA